jgi:prophage maintenance system killer protein
MMKRDTKLVLYQTESGSVEVRLDESKDNVFLTQQQVGELFDVQKAAISKHVNNIFKSGELDKKSTVSKMETVHKEGNRLIKRNIEYYNLDVILSVGYRVNSKKATIFRQWATKVLKQHMLSGYTINRRRLAGNYAKFQEALGSVKKFLPATDKLKTSDVLDLINMFASTWLSLDAYDKASLPKGGNIKKRISVTSEELSQALLNLKETLQREGTATDIFGQVKRDGEIDSIIRNVFQSYGGKDLYPTLEEKAANLLYFIAKGHPFLDGNKRSAAFAFIWFLRKSGILSIAKITPEALTALTLLVAESNPKDKEKIIGLVLMLIKD